MQMYRTHSTTLICSLLIASLFFAVPQAMADPLDVIVIVIRIDLCTTAQKTFLKKYLNNLYGRPVASTFFGKDSVIYEGTNKCYYAINTIQALKQSGVDITLAKFKEDIHYADHTNKIWVVRVLEKCQLAVWFIEKRMTDIILF